MSGTIASTRRLARRLGASLCRRAAGTSTFSICCYRRRVLPFTATSAFMAFLLILMVADCAVTNNGSHLIIPAGGAVPASWISGKVPCGNPSCPSAGGTFFPSIDSSTWSKTSRGSGGSMGWRFVIESSKAVSFSSRLVFFPFRPCESSSN